MSSISIRPFDINGVINTGNNVMNNLDLLCKACGAWMTYDIADGKWCVIIKQEGSPVANFDDTNIIGNINVSSTGITDLYNKVTITYPHKDLADKTDQIDLEISADKRYADEIDNTLQIQTDLLNDPIQAQFIASVELKQNRLDTAIEFTTDFTMLGLKAGDIITVTNDIYGYYQKYFRIIKVTEEDADVITVSITALEYDANVYNSDGLVYTKRDIKTGIIPKSANTVINTKDATAIVNAGTKNQAIGKIVVDGSAPGVSVLCKWFFVDALYVPANGQFNTTVFDGNYTNGFEGLGQFKIDYFVNWGSNVTPPPINGCLKNTMINVYVNGVAQTLGLWAFTGDLYEPLYADHQVIGYFQCPKDAVVTYGISVGTDMGAGFSSYQVNDQTGQIDHYVVSAGAETYVWVVGNITYLGPVV